MSDNFKNQVVFFSVFLLVLANIYVWQFIFSLDNDLTITFFDIGQGDSAFITTSQGHQIIIDGGPGNRLVNKIGKAMPMWDRSVDLVILTHPEYDHLSGLIEVFARYDIENIIWTGIETNGNIFEQWQKALANEAQDGAKIVFAKAGQKIIAGRTIGEVISPREDLSGEFSDKGVNETSIVVLFGFGANKFLFTGDIGERTEKALLANNSDIKADVLKIAHHGSKYSSSPEFLAAVSPQIAVISCGANNTYGHPAKEVLNNLQNFAINVRRTDQGGDVIIKSDGKSLIK